MAQLDLLVETDVQVPQHQGEKNNATNTLFVCFGHLGGHVTSVFVQEQHVHSFSNKSALFLLHNIPWLCFHMFVHHHGASHLCGAMCACGKEGRILANLCCCEFLANLGSRSEVSKKRTQCSVLIQFCTYLSLSFEAAGTAPQFFTQACPHVQEYL